MTLPELLIRLPESPLEPLFMKTKSNATCAMTIICIASSALAASPSPTPFKMAPAKEDRVTAISSNLITITHSHGKAITKGGKLYNMEYRDISKSFKIVWSTVVTVNGKKSTSADIKVGMAVSVSADGATSDLPDDHSMPIARRIVLRDANR